MARKQVISNTAEKPSAAFASPWEALLQEERFRLMIQNSNDSIVLIDQNGHQIFMNEAASRISGHSIEELLGPFERVIIPEDLPEVNAAWQKVVSTNEIVRIQYRHIHKTRSYVWMEAVGQNHIHNPNINAVVINVRDITEQKEAEARILQKNIELNQLLEQRKRELITNAMMLSQLNAFHRRIMNGLSMMSRQSGKELQHEINSLLSEVSVSSRMFNLEEFQQRFEELHHDFFDRLTKRFPDLSPAEKKLAAFIRLGLSCKDISALTLNTSESVHVARSRLRRKIEMVSGENLQLFISRI